MMNKVSHAEIDSFFSEYVYGFIAGDIKREIDRARGGDPAGNFLCALALLCYTEVLGGVQRGTLAQREGRANFEAFFTSLGPVYAALLHGGLDAYKVFRCGMAHEYFVKGEATVTMLKGVEPAGIAKHPVSGRYFFCVERYFDDFIAAARRLHASMLADTQGSLPREIAGRI
jgi:hypothetical protein